MHGGLFIILIFFFLILKGAVSGGTEPTRGSPLSSLIALENQWELLWNQNQEPILYLWRYLSSFYLENISWNHSACNWWTNNHCILLHPHWAGWFISHSNEEVNLVPSSWKVLLLRVSDLQHFYITLVVYSMYGMKSQWLL